MLVFELTIGSGQKLFPPQFSVMDPYPRAGRVTTEDSSTILSQKLKPQSLTWAGKGLDFWIADPIYLQVSKIYTSMDCRPHTSHFKL